MTLIIQLLSAIDIYVFTCIYLHFYGLKKYKLVRVRIGTKRYQKAYPLQVQAEQGTRNTGTGSSYLDFQPNSDVSCI